MKFSFATLSSAVLTVLYGIVLAGFGVPLVLQQCDYDCQIEMTVVPFAMGLFALSGFATFRIQKDSRFWRIAHLVLWLPWVLGGVGAAFDHYMQWKLTRHDAMLPASIAPDHQARPLSSTST